jgi:hypothetical protein
VSQHQSNSDEERETDVELAAFEVLPAFGLQIVVVVPEIVDAERQTEVVDQEIGLEGAYQLDFVGPE